jgi:ssDNA-binding replication factor A large subunit
MKVNELKDKKAVEEIILTITEKQEPRDVRGGSLRVCNCTCEDDTGKVLMTLWNDDIDRFEQGDKIKITKGWSQIYQDAMQVSSGKFGKIEKVEE